MNSAKTAREAGLDKKDLNHFVDVAKKASKLASKILMSHYGSIKSIENKGRVGDLVTNADIETEDVIIKHLQKETPLISILAEESGSKVKTSELTWVIDPLDGTTNFAHGYPFFGTSIGLTYLDQPILGVISIPFLNEYYWCSPNEGSFCNDKKIRVSSQKELIDSLLVTGFAYDRHTRVDNNYAEFCWFTHRTRGVRRGGAAAIDLAFVASGRIDGYWERGLAKWDLAAGVALVEIAGGVVCNYEGEKADISTGMILACAPSIKDEMVRELNSVSPLKGETYGAPELDKGLVKNNRS